MASRYVEVMYRDGPPMLASIDERTPNKVNGHGTVGDLQRRGYTITPLVALTPERVAALRYALGQGWDEYNATLDEAQPHIAALREMMMEDDDESA